MIKSFHGPCNQNQMLDVTWAKYQGDIRMLGITWAGGNTFVEMPGQGSMPAVLAPHQSAIVHPEMEYFG
jgi:hypothetical protein